MASSNRASGDARGSATHAGAATAPNDLQEDLLAFELAQMTLAPQPPMGQLMCGRLYSRATGAAVANVTLQGHLASGAVQVVTLDVPRRACWYVPAGSPALTIDPLPSGTRATAILRFSAPPHLPAGQLLFEALPTTRMTTLQFYLGVAVLECRSS